jgi:hypothetical protein
MSGAAPKLRSDSDSTGCSIIAVVPGAPCGMIPEVLRQNAFPAAGC